MKVTYIDKYMERLCTDYNFAVKEINVVKAKNLSFCVQALESFDSVETLIKLRVRKCHALINYKAGDYYAMHLTGNYRLIFTKGKDEGELHVVRIEEIVDYH